MSESQGWWWGLGRRGVRRLSRIVHPGANDEVLEVSRAVRPVALGRDADQEATVGIKFVLEQAIGYAGAVRAVPPPTRKTP